MPEIGTSGSMSGDGKRGVAAWLKLSRPSSALHVCDGASAAVVANVEGGRREVLMVQAEQRRHLPTRRGRQQKMATDPQAASGHDF